MHEAECRVLRNHCPHKIEVNSAPHPVFQLIAPLRLLHLKNHSAFPDCDCCDSSIAVERYKRVKQLESHLELRRNDKVLRDIIINPVGFFCDSVARPIKWVLAYFEALNERV